MSKTVAALSRRDEGLFDVLHHRLRRCNVLSEKSNDASARLGGFLVGELIEERHERVLGGDALEQLAV